MNRGIEMKTLNNERGAVLITTLLLLVIITLIGLIAINTATVDIQISGQTRRSSMAFGGAEAGVDLSIAIIENTIKNNTLTPSSVPTGPITTLDTAGLEGEILGDNPYNPDTPANKDFAMSNLNNVAVDVDIDYLYPYIMPGGSAEFAVGYEGVGVTGGKAVLYRIDSQGTI